MNTAAMNLADVVTVMNFDEQTAAKLKVKDGELVVFTTQLAVMLDSGVVLSDALEAIVLQLKPGDFQAVVQEVSDAIKNGKSFSEALARYPRIFNSMFVSMVRASELSGNMSRMMEVLTSYLNAEQETRKQVKSALVYPVMMLLMAVAATGSLMFFVLPRFTKIYQSRGASLPKLTQALVSTSQMLGDPRFMAIAITLLAVFIVWFNYWRRQPSGQKVIDFIIVNMPIFGTMFVDTVLTRSMRILATMVNTGVSLLDSLEVMKISCRNHYFKALWTTVDVKLRDGFQFSDSIMSSPGGELISPAVIQMIRAGEKSGKLGHVCDKVSIFYEKKLQSSIKTVTTMIEPIMISVMGLIIGTIAIALLLPVFRISSVISH